MAWLCRGVRCLIVGLCAGFALPAQAKTLTFAFGDHNEAPFALVQNGQLTGGFALDFGKALAAKLGMEAAFRFVPRNRIGAEIMAGTVDAYCLAAAPYYPSFAPDRFTQSFFTEQDVMVLSTAFPGRADLSSLNGVRVGTVLGFVYPPEVEALFASGKAERINARNAEGNLHKLMNGRLDAVILPYAAWRYALSHDPALGKAVRADFIPLVARDRVCLVSPASAASVAEMNGAIQALAADGSLAAMVRDMGLMPPGQR